MRSLESRVVWSEDDGENMRTRMRSVLRWQMGGEKEGVVSQGVAEMLALGAADYVEGGKGRSCDRRGDGGREDEGAAHIYQVVAHERSPGREAAGGAKGLAERPYENVWHDLGLMTKAAASDARSS